MYTKGKQHQGKKVLYISDRNLKWTECCVWTRDILSTSDAHACKQTRTSAATVMWYLELVMI